MNLFSKKSPPAEEKDVSNSPEEDMSDIQDKELAAPDNVSTEDAPSQDEADKGAEEYFMHGIKLYILIFGLSLAILLMALDMSILVTAIPLITEKFNSTEDIGWYISAYMLTICAIQPISGKLYANFSLKWTFLTFLFVFEVGSAVSGAATSSEMLIIGRAIAGIGAAGLLSGGLSIVSVVVALRFRALFTGILASMFGIASIAGPLIGGAFTQHVSWRWVFYINLPAGAATAGALILFFHPPARKVETDPLKEKIKRLDLIGAAIFIPAIIMLLMALQWGGLTYPWNSSRIIGLFVGGGVTVIIFGFWLRHAGDEAMIPPSVFTQRTVFWACITAMFGMGAQIMLGVWMPEWFQVVKGDSPVNSGVHLLPAMLAQTIAALVSGGLIPVLGYFNPWIIAGTVLLSISNGLFTTFEVDTPSSYWIGYQVIYGVGGGFFMAGPIVAIQSVLTPEQTPVGISTVTFFQMFGGALFSALSQTIFSEQLVRELVKNVPGVDIPMLLAAGTSAVHKVAPPEQLSSIIQAYNTALLDPFYLAAGITALGTFTALGMEWVNVKGKALSPGGA